MAALNGFGDRALISLMTQGKFAPSDPSEGFFTSMISAARDRRASSISPGLTSNCIGFNDLLS
jgi:hypothetical protein